MRANPHDLLVTLRKGGPDGSQLRKVHLYLSETGVTRLMEFDIRDPQYNSAPAELLSAAMAQLLAEIRARQLQKVEFCVWYYTAQERDVVEAASARLADQQDYWRRYADILIAKARLVDESSIQAEAE